MTDEARETAPLCNLCRAPREGLVVCCPLCLLVLTQAKVQGPDIFDVALTSLSAAAVAGKEGDEFREFSQAVVDKYFAVLAAIRRAADQERGGKS